ncbi:hypothetical protein ABTN76_19560, partial [Acinetobacter baumannii]
FEAIEMGRKSFNDIEVNFNFTSVPEKEEDLEIRANDALLKAALLNLIKNAYLYSYDKKVTIELQANESAIKIAFENEGDLITEKEAESVMMP